MYTWLMALKIDVLPAPLGPMMANSSPDLMTKETSLIAITPPKRSWIESTSSNGSVSAYVVVSRSLRSLTTTTVCAACSA